MPPCEHKMFKLLFKESVKKDFRHIGKEAAARILKDIRTKLLPDPRKAGKPLKSRDGTLWSFRVSDYRVLYVFNEKEIWVLVVRIGHRKEIYQNLPDLK